MLHLLVYRLIDWLIDWLINWLVIYRYCMYVSIGWSLGNSIFKWLTCYIPSVLVIWRNRCFYFLQLIISIAYVLSFKMDPFPQCSQLYQHYKCVVKVLIPSFIEHTYMLLLEVLRYISSTIYSFSTVSAKLIYQYSRLKLLHSRTAEH